MMRTRYRRFSLRTLLIVLTVLCIWIGWYSWVAHRQAKAVSEIRNVGGVVYYSHQMKGFTDPPNPMRKIIAEKLGEEWAYTVAGVTFYPDKNHTADDLVQVLSYIPNLQRLSIWPEARGLTMLDEKASFGLTDKGVDVIIKNAPYLQHLSISAARVSDNKIDELLQRHNFTSLQIHRHPDFGSDAVDTYTDSKGPHIIDLRKSK
jgi:hypothetical protein